MLELDALSVLPPGKSVALVGCSGSTPAVTMTTTGAVWLVVVLPLVAVLLSPAFVRVPAGLMAMGLAGVVLVCVCTWEEDCVPDISSALGVASSLAEG
ncbi:hypothetical protein BJX76DRAFT_336649 [Aspergillus varians]